MKTVKKSGVCAVLAVTLLAATMLMTACSGDPAPGYNIPEGMGAVRLDMNIDAARATFLPGTTINDFTAFRVTFTPGVGSPVEEIWDNKATPAKRSGSITLVPETYTLTVIAYMEGTAAAPTTPGATATQTGILIAAGPNTPLTATLKAYAPGTALETGTFVWDITNGPITNLTAATMNVKEISDPGAGTTYNLMGATGTNVWSYPAGVSLPTGFYYVTFSLTSGTGAPAIIRTFQHILHIYRGQTTTVSYTFNNDVMGIVSTTVTVTVTYSPPTDGPPVIYNITGGTPGTAVAAGATITLDSTDDPSALPTPIIPEFVTLAVNNADDFRTLTDPGDPDALPTPIPPTYVHNYTWYYNGTAVAGYTGANLVVNTAVAPFNVKGKYQLTVVGLLTETRAVALNTYTGAPFTTEIFIEVK
jgi:hypothetical protein